MNAKHPATFGTEPPLVFTHDELPDPDLSYVDKILNWTHSIGCSIPFVQVSHNGTGKIVATETEPDSDPFQIPAVLDLAVHTGIGFGSVVSPAPGAGLPLSCIGTAEATVHAAGSY